MRCSSTTSSHRFTTTSASASSRMGRRASSRGTQARARAMSSTASSARPRAAPTPRARRTAARLTAASSSCCWGRRARAASGTGRRRRAPSTASDVPPTGGTTPKAATCSCSARRSVTPRLRRPGAGLAGLALVLVADTVVWTRSLGKAANFDEGGYSVALDALRHGQDLGSEVFLVQPPLFYNLLQGIAWLVGPSFDELRAGMLVLSLVGIVAVFVLGRALGGDRAGVAAAALYSITPPFPANAPLIEADPPSVTFALVALALAAHGYGRGRHGALAFLVGDALAASILTKLFTVTAFAPVLALALWLRATRRQLILTAAGGVALTLVTVLPHLNALPELWDGVVGGHLEQREVESPGHLDNLRRVVDFFDPRTPATYLLLAGVAAFAWRRPAGGWSLWTWTAAADALSFAIHTMLVRHHVLLTSGTYVSATYVLGSTYSSLRFPARVAAAAGALLLAGAEIGRAHV